MFEMLYFVLGIVLLGPWKRKVKQKLEPEVPPKRLVSDISPSIFEFVYEKSSWRIQSVPIHRWPGAHCPVWEGDNMTDKANRTIYIHRLPLPTI